MPTGSCLRFLFAPWSKGQRSRGQGWQAICWGWYFGGEEFRETLEELAGKAVEGLRRESFTGEALRKRDAAETLRVLNAGLKSLGMGRDEARGLGKVEPRKQGLSWLVKTRTGIPDAWICEALDMGDRSNISRAVSAYRKEKTKEFRKWKHVLHACTDFSEKIGSREKCSSVPPKRLPRRAVRGLGAHSPQQTGSFR